MQVGWPSRITEGHIREGAQGLRRSLELNQAGIKPGPLQSL